MNNQLPTPDGMVSLTLGHGHTVHGTVDAISHAQACLLIDSKHPVESKDNARYFSRLADEYAARNRLLEAALVKTRGDIRGMLQRLEGV